MFCKQTSPPDPIWALTWLLRDLNPHKHIKIRKKTWCKGYEVQLMNPTASCKNGNWCSVWGAIKIPFIIYVMTGKGPLAYTSMNTHGVTAACQQHCICLTYLFIQLWGRQSTKFLLSFVLFPTLWYFHASLSLNWPCTEHENMKPHLTAKSLFSFFVHAGRIV